MSFNREPQRRAFDFLLQKCSTQDLFTRKEFQDATGWSDASFDTYLSKQFKELLIPVGNKFRVTFAFRRFATWPKFRDQIVTQNRRITRAYTRRLHQSVVVFEFFMPLRNEEFLRDSLDGLFYKDSLLTRLSTLDQEGIRERIPPLKNEPAAEYLTRVCEWLSGKFSGYSISHVSGRFRSSDLKTLQQAAEDAATKTQKYLIDETTAVVRFIFPCDTQEDPGEKNSKAAQREALQIRWFFHQLFVNAVLEVISGEDEVWLLETGMCNQLHTYSAER